jgi:hypothetical protein
MDALEQFWTLFTKEDHKALARWAAKCAEHVLPLFEEKYPEDRRPRHALETLDEWIETGEFRMQVIRHASLAAHAAAREVAEDKAAHFAARAAGQAVATAHVPTHGVGPALYALKALAATMPPDLQSVIAQERAWQLGKVPDNLRNWVLSTLQEKQQLLPKNLRI